MIHPSLVSTDIPAHQKFAYIGYLVRVHYDPELIVNGSILYKNHHLKVLVIAPALRRRQMDERSIMTIPPLGYGGIEIFIHSLISGLIAVGCDVTLIGAPGSYSNIGLRVIRDIREVETIRSWVLTHHREFNIIHDHSCGLVFSNGYKLEKSINYIATHHKTGKPDYPRNIVFLSEAQRLQACVVGAPVIRIPVILNDYLYCEHKDDYYLYMGRVSAWKGVREAALICREHSKQLYIAGPAWEKEYFNNIMGEFAGTVVYIGEISGLHKIDLISKAKAVMVLSRPLLGPWGDVWVEPGSTVVSEAAASGTPVISSANGCLKEIVVHDIGIQLTEFEIENLDTGRISSQLPHPSRTLEYAKKNWGHLEIAKQYVHLYENIVATSLL